MKKILLLFLLLIPFIITGCKPDEEKPKEYSFTFELYNETERIVNETVTYKEDDNLIDVLKSKYSLVYEGEIKEIKSLLLSDVAYFKITLNGEVKTNLNFVISDQDHLKIEYLKNEEPVITKYTVTFKEVDDSVFATKVVNENEIVVLPETPVREGYNFKGFYLDKEAVNEFVSNTSITSDLVVYVIYEEVETHIETTDINVEFPTLSLRKMTPPENKTNGLIVLSPEGAVIETYGLTVSDPTKLQSFIFTDPQDGLRKVHVECLDYGEADVIITVNGISKTYSFTLYPRKEEEVPFDEWFEMSFEEQEAMRIDRERREAEAEVNEVARIKDWFASSLPNSTTEYFELIDRSNASGVSLTWFTSNEAVLYPTYVDSVYVAQVNQISYDVTVTLTLMIKSGAGEETLTKEISVPGISLKPIPSRPLIFAYIRSDTFKGIEPADISRVDVFNICFATVRGGSFSFASVKSLLPHLMPLRQLGKRIVISVQDGGKNASGGVPETKGFSAAVATAEGRTKIVTEMVETVIKYDLDGIDLDWEGPGFSFSNNPSSPNDVKNFELFVRELREAMDASPRKDLLLTAACAMSYPHNYSLGKLKDDFDYIHIMTYDGDSAGTTSHHSATKSGRGAAWSAEKAVANFVATGYPKNRLTIGSAFYGKIWDVSGSSTDGIGLSGANRRTSSYANIRREYLLDLNNPVNIQRSNETLTTWYYDGSKFITFEDPWAVAEKAKWAKAQGLGGMMMWEYNFDYQCELMEALYNNFR